MGRILWGFFVGIVAMAMANAALAEGACTKLRGIYLELTPTDDGYLVPMQVNGRSHLFLLSFTSGFAKLDEKIAVEDKMPIKGLPRSMLGVSDGEVTYKKIATAATIQLGGIPRHDAEFLIRGHSEKWGAKADGVVGMNVLAGLDLELDLKHNKLGLFLPGHCPFVPYWGHDVVGSAPFELSPSGVIIMPMTLDDQNVIVALGTANQTAKMQYNVARLLFKIDTKKPVATDAKEKPELYHTFDALKADGISILNPKMEIDFTQKEPCTGVGGRWLDRMGRDNSCIGGGDVILGIKELRQLRMFFDFGEKKVYFTPAEKSVSP